MAAYKFPNASERSEKTPAVFCSNNRVVALYNTAHGKDAKRIAKKMRKWFVDEAKAKGWSAAIFLTDVETRHSSGCLLYKSSAKKVQINVFVTGDGDD